VVVYARCSAEEVRLKEVLYVHSETLWESVVGITEEALYLLLAGHASPHKMCFILQPFLSQFIFTISVHIKYFNTKALISVMHDYSCSKFFLFI